VAALVLQVICALYVILGNESALDIVAKEPLNMVMRTVAGFRGGERDLRRGHACMA
jgi:hypothetical protein